MTTRHRLVVLGGSSPFTAAFVDALKTAAGKLPPFDLVLFGRNESNLDVVRTYAERQLREFGWRASATTLIETALTEAAFVVHQIRYGGLELRADAERLCARYGVLADETLGPAALLTALQSLPELDSVCSAIQRHCPDAWVLNLTNPLSCVTHRMAERGVTRCIGLCELPKVTVRQAVEICGSESELSSSASFGTADEIDWRYAGLNHRGFIVELRIGGRDLIEELPQRLGSRRLGGISAERISKLRAIPLKYFQLITGRSAPAAGRAGFLQELTPQILRELRASPDVSPPSLQKRYLEWYPESVVPLLIALTSDQPTLQVVNLPGGDEIVWETRAKVSRNCVRGLPHEEPPQPVARWIDRFVEHERAFVRAVANPSLVSIRETLLADPIVSDDQAEPIAESLWNNFRMSHRKKEAVDL